MQSLLRPNHFQAQGATILVPEQPNINASLVKVVAASQLANALALNVRAEADAALHVPAAQVLLAGAAPENQSLGILLKHLWWDTPPEVGAHEVVEQEDTQDPVKHNAGIVEQAVLPELLGKVCLLGAAAKAPGQQRGQRQPAVIEQQEAPLQTEGMLVDVQESLCHELRRWLAPRLHEEPAGPDPEVGPRRRQRDPRQAEAPQQEIPAAVALAAWRPQHQPCTMED